MIWSHKLFFFLAKKKLKTNIWTQQISKIPSMYKIQLNTLTVSTPNEQSEKEIIKACSFTSVWKELRYWVINLSTVSEDLNNYQTLMRETKEDINKWTLITCTRNGRDTTVWICLQECMQVNNETWEGVLQHWSAGKRTSKPQQHCPWGELLRTKPREQQGLGRVWGTGGPVCCETLQLLLQRAWQLFKTSNIELLYDPANSLLGVKTK